ncbi:MAG: hypothetical protein ACWA5T_06620 [Parvularcula sp.]
MYNTLARVIGVTVLGGAAVFAGYSLTQGKGPANKVSAETEEAVSAPSSQPTAPDGTVAGAPSATGDLDDLLAAGEKDRVSVGADAGDQVSPYDTDRLAALGEGGILDDETSPADLADSADNNEPTSEGNPTASSDTMAILEDLSDEGVPETDGPAAQGAVATVAAAQPGLRGLPASPATGQATADEAAGQQDGAPATPAMDTVAQDISSAANDVTNDGAADLQAEADPQMAEAIPTDTAPTDQPTRTATGPRDGSGKVMLANAVEPDKPDDGRYFTTNKKLIDKPDDGAYFTAQDSGAAYSPCVKADGTPYIGPGTALNPFAEASPCLPQATAESFDVAGNLLTATDSDGLPEAPQWPVVSDPRTPFPPLGPNFTSDYTSL